jgi:iron complex outermembrane receptor protein
VESGAVGIATNDPEPEPDAYADVLYGTRNQRQLRSAVNLPLSATGVAVRFAGTVIRRDGYSRNVYRDEDVDDRDYSSWRGKLGFSPSQNLKIVVGTEQSAQDDTQGMSGQPDPQVGVNGGILAGGTVPADPREVMRNADEYQTIDKHRSHAKILWQVNNVEVLSITARQALQLDTASDLDGTEADYSSRITREDVQMVSQEVRIRSLADGPFAWETGLYYQRENATQQLGAYLPLLGVSSLARSESVDTTSALFASLSYAFTAHWRGRVGARDSHDRVDLRLNQTVTTPMGTQSLPFEDDKDWHTVTPEVGLSFAPNQDRLYYVSVSRGYKAGGYNAYAIQPAYSPEWLTAYEAGFKATFPRRLTRLNAALFYYDYRDMQILTLDSGAPAGSLPIIANAARAGVRGLDLQTSYRPGDFALTLGATLLDARFEEFDAVDPNNPARNTDRAGEPLPKAPDASWVLGGEYRWRRPGADLRLTISYRYQTKIYFNSFADPAVAQGAYGLLNASLVYENTKQNWFVELYGQNLTNELYAQNVVRVDPIVGTRRIWGAPRSIGIRVAYPL